MKNSKFYWNDKNQKVEIWSEDVNGSTDFWMRVNCISESITERQYKNRLKKLNF